MGSTGDPSGESSLAPCGPVTSSRKRGAGRKGAPATQQAICPALSDSYNPQYRSLFRLAVLLTGDADAAEAVVLDSSCRVVRLRKRPQTEDDALPHPRRLLGGPVTAGPASPSLGRQLAAPGRGRGRLLHRHSVRGTAARTLGRDPGSAQAANQPAGSDRAHSLPGPRLRAGRRGHTGEPGHAATLPGRGRSAPKAVLPSSP
jgi:hypothetical protein